MTKPIEARKKAEEKYLQAKKKLEIPQSPELFSLAAQEANDAWLEFKKADLDASNYLTLKKLGDLYGC